MTSHARKIEQAEPVLTKPTDELPAFVVTGAQSLAIRAGTVVAGEVFEKETEVKFAGGHPLVAGADYAITIVKGFPTAWRAYRLPAGDGVIGGFHFAPGGNATGNAGGDDVPAINPRSLWDLNFRPTCPDPRGMTLVELGAAKFWADIYLLGVNHLTDGTSKFGATIADGRDPPLDPRGKSFHKLDYETARAVLAHHGKGLMSQAEFQAFAEGVTEGTACGTDPKVTGLDARRTSRVGGMQATGNMWIWGHNGGTSPVASLFGGGWWHDRVAGPRCALVDYWPDYSSGDLGARGRSDHLQLA